MPIACARPRRSRARMRMHHFGRALAVFSVDAPRQSAGHDKPRMVIIDDAMKMPFLRRVMSSPPLAHAGRTGALGVDSSLPAPTRPAGFPLRTMPQRIDTHDHLFRRSAYTPHARTCRLSPLKMPTTSRLSRQVASSRCIYQQFHFSSLAF